MRKKSFERASKSRFLGRSSSLQLAAMGPAASVFDSASLVLTFLNTATLSLLGMSAGDAKKIRQIRSHAIFLATSSGLLRLIALPPLSMHTPSSK